MDQFMGFVPTADKNTVTTNYTGDRGVSVLIRDEAYRHGSFIDIVVCCDNDAFNMNSSSIHMFYTISVP